jgi:hypothetical protein
MGPTVAGRLPFAKNSFSRLDNRPHGPAQGLLSEKSNQTTTASKSMSAGGGLSGPIVH